MDAFANLCPTLNGRLVVLEPLRADHEPALRLAAADERVWRFMRTVASEPDAFRRWFGEALAASAAGTEAPFCIVRRGDGAAVGSSRFLALRPADRVLEIGHSWVTPSAWGSGANTEAKLLLLTHTFEGSAACGSSSRPMPATSDPGRRWPRSQPTSRACSASTCW